MQMQGLQKALGTRAASLQSLEAGMDMLCIGNNLFDQEAGDGGYRRSRHARLRDEALDACRHRPIDRAGAEARKTLLR